MAKIYIYSALYSYILTLRFLTVRSSQWNNLCLKNILYKNDQQHTALHKKVQLATLIPALNSNSDLRYPYRANRYGRTVLRTWKGIFSETISNLRSSKLWSGVLEYTIQSWQNTAIRTLISNSDLLLYIPIYRRDTVQNMDFHMLDFVAHLKNSNSNWPSGAQLDPASA